MAATRNYSKVLPVKTILLINVENVEKPCIVKQITMSGRPKNMKIVMLCIKNLRSGQVLVTCLWPHIIKKERKKILVLLILKYF